MPVLHNNSEDSDKDGSPYSAYTEANTGLTGEARLTQWYADYIQGTIHTEYPGGTNTLRGVHEDWWQYHPLYKTEGLTSNPRDGATGVSTSPTITINWPGAVDGIFYPDIGYFVVLCDGNDDHEIGLYYVAPSAMSPDKKTLTINWPGSVVKNGGPNPVTPLAAGTKYRLHSYGAGYAYQDAERFKYKKLNFSISFTTAE
jgi:hypothetical protein